MKSIFLVLIMVFGLVSCGGDDGVPVSELIHDTTYDQSMIQASDHYILINETHYFDNEKVSISFFRLNVTSCEFYCGVEVLERFDTTDNVNKLVEVSLTSFKTLDGHLRGSPQAVKTRYRRQNAYTTSNESNAGWAVDEFIKKYGSMPVTFMEGGLVELEHDTNSHFLWVQKPIKRTLQEKVDQLNAIVMYWL